MSSCIFEHGAETLVCGPKELITGVKYDEGRELCYQLFYRAHTQRRAKCSLKAPSATANHFPRSHCNFRHITAPVSVPVV